MEVDIAEEKKDSGDEKKDKLKDGEGDKKEAEKKEEKKEVKKDEKPVEEKKVEKKDEPKFELLSNPARVIVEQRSVMDIPSDCRYSTVWNRPGLGGFVILKDNKNGIDEEIIEALKPTIAADEGTTEEKEPSPPEPFEYTE